MTCLLADTHWWNTEASVILSHGRRRTEQSERGSEKGNRSAKRGGQYAEAVFAYCIDPKEKRAGKEQERSTVA